MSDEFINWEEPLELPLDKQQLLDMYSSIFSFGFDMKKVKEHTVKLDGCPIIKYSEAKLYRACVDGAPSLYLSLRRWPPSDGKRGFHLTVYSDPYIVENYFVSPSLLNCEEVVSTLEKYLLYVKKK